MNNSGFRGAPLPAPAWPQPRVSSWTLGGALAPRRITQLRVARATVRLRLGICGWEQKHALLPRWGECAGAQGARTRRCAGAQVPRCRAGPSPVWGVGGCCHRPPPSRTSGHALSAKGPTRWPQTRAHARGELRRGNSLVAEGPRAVAMGTPRPAGRPRGFVGPRAPEGRTGGPSPHLSIPALLPFALAWA